MLSDPPGARPAEPHAPETILESGVPLSRSLLWPLGRSFYEKQGVAAWRSGAVPWFITNNAFIAGAWANIVMGFLQDCAAAGAPTEPIPIVELGAGCGRF